MALLEEIDGIGMIVTSRGDENIDYVSRYFAPKIGIPEYAATGSIHCALAPYWSKRLGKSELRAVQLSQRRGELVRILFTEKNRSHSMRAWVISVTTPE
jgi:predicted PhzF superfamily epimerase YddE/YHI9